MRTFLLAALIGLGTSPAAAQQAADSTAVLEAVHAFHAALASGDSTAALGRLHPAVLVYESGHAETLEQYRGGHLPADIAFARATRRETTGETVSVWNDVALYTSESRTTGEWRGRAIDSRGAETMVLERTSDGWRIRHIHWSAGR